MTGKRFFQNKSLEEDSFVISDGVIDGETDRILRYDKEYCDLLNELHEEKEDLTTKKEDAEYELLYLKEKYEELLEEKEKYKKEMLHYENEVEELRKEIFEGDLNDL